MAGALGLVLTGDTVPVEGRHAIPVYVDDSLPIVGPSRACVVTTGEIPQAGGPPLAVRLAPVGTPAVGPAIPVYVVSGSLGGAVVLPPVNTGLPVISGTLAIGALLSTTDGTWTNSPTSYTYQWKRGGVSIGGATANTYTLVAADQGTTITVEVTATNAGGSASATSTGVAIPSMRDTLLANATYAWFEGLPGSGNVGSWTDIIAGEVAAISGTASGCVVGTLNGRPGVLYNATGNLVTPAFAAGAVSQPHIIISVFDWDITTVFRYIHDGLGASNSARLFRDGTPRANIFAGANLAADIDFTLTPSYAVITFNGVSSSINLNGTIKTGSAGAQTLTGMTIGALAANTNRFNGTIALIAVVSGANYVARAASILSALQAYYSFP